MEANLTLFDPSRQASGNFTTDDLQDIRSKFLQHLTSWFHDLKSASLKDPPAWLTTIVKKMRDESADVISFNWDLVLDHLLLGPDFSAEHYGFNATSLGKRVDGPRLLKPHGSLNWYLVNENKKIRQEKQVLLVDTPSNPEEAVFAFNAFRAPTSKTNQIYRPLIIAPIYTKRFDGEVFQQLWRETVSVLSKATRIYFIGFSLAKADFHARFILQCGFFNQTHGELLGSGKRSRSTGKAAVTVVDPSDDAHANVQSAVGWPTSFARMTVEDWVNNGFKPRANARTNPLTAPPHITKPVIPRLKHESSAKDKGAPSKAAPSATKRPSRR